MREGASVRQAEDTARRIKKRIKQPFTKQVDEEKSLIVSDNLDQVIKDFSQALGGEEKVKIKLTRSRVQTRIFINLKGNLESTRPFLYQIYTGITGKQTDKLALE